MYIGLAGMLDEAVLVPSWSDETQKKAAHNGHARARWARGLSRPDGLCGAEAGIHLVDHFGVHVAPWASLGPGTFPNERVRFVCCNFFFLQAVNRLSRQVSTLMLLVCELQGWRKTATGSGWVVVLCFIVVGRYCGLEMV